MTEVLDDPSAWRTFVSGHEGVLARLAGIDRLEERFDQQELRSRERHERTAETLGEIKGDVGELNEKVGIQNGRVRKVEVVLGIAEDREEQAKERRALWHQHAHGFLIAGVGGFVGVAGGGVLVAWMTGGLGH